MALASTATMKMTIREAAALLGRSPRTLRSQVLRGDIPATKRGGHWILPSDTLPLTKDQRRSLQAKADRVRRAVDEVLPSRAARSRGDKSRSLADVAAFDSARSVLAQMQAAADLGLPGVDAAAGELAAALLHLGEANTLFDRRAKLEALGSCRRRLGRAVAHLLMHHDHEVPDPVGAWVSSLENEAAPALAGLARWVERLPDVKP